MSTALLYLHFDVKGSLLESARQCEEEVFLRSYGNTRAQLDAEYGAYDDQSVFLAVADESEFVYGAMRLIAPGAAGLKTLNDLYREPWGIDGNRAARAAGVDPDTAWDVATVGVRNEFRGQRFMVSMALYHGMFQTALANGVASGTAVLDETASRVLAMVGYHMSTLPGARTAPYLGSAASTPAYAHIARVTDAQRRLNPDAYRLMTLGIGLDGISVPELAAFVYTPQPARELVASSAGVLAGAAAA